MAAEANVIWVDGQVIPAADAMVPLLSHAVQRGSTVFDVLRVVSTNDGPAVLGLRPHLARFGRSMELMGMDHRYSLAELEAALLDTVRASPGTPVVKVVATWSEPSLGALPESSRPQVWIAALGPESAPPSPPEGGVRLRSAGGPKTPVEVLPPSLKVAASYTPGVRERMQAKAAGFDDVIFRTVDGDLAEGTTQSIFVVQGETLLLPPLDVVLDGVTRRLMIDVAQHVGVHVLIRGVFWDEVLNADELFLCSTNYPVSPVRQVDNRSFALPGPVATRLAKEVEALFTGEHPLAQRWLTPVSGRRRP